LSRICFVVMFFASVFIHAQTMRLSGPEKSVVQIEVQKPDKSFVPCGTGFFVRGDGIIATAFHVYSKAVQTISESRGGDIFAERATRQSGTFTASNIQPAAVDATHDLILLKIVKKDDNLWDKVGGATSLVPTTAKEFDSGTDVTVVGYFGSDAFPVTVGAKLVGETTFTIFPGNDIGEFLVSAFAVPGQSGSPVILNDGTLLGVILSIVPVTVPFNDKPLPSGLNRVAKAEFLQRLLSSLPK
jgi:S1-C subfamily serine protease